MILGLYAKSRQAFVTRQPPFPLQKKRGLSGFFWPGLNLPILFLPWSIWIPRLYNFKPDDCIYAIKRTVQMFIRLHVPLPKKNSIFFPPILPLKVIEFESCIKGKMLFSRHYQNSNHEAAKVEKAKYFKYISEKAKL